MEARAAVTLSNENGPSYSRPYREPPPAANGRQRPASTPRQPDPPNATHRLSMRRPRWAR
jgi:hypothetical protein